jgi:hypothetical protein
MWGGAQARAEFASGPFLQVPSRTLSWNLMLQVAPSDNPSQAVKASLGGWRWGPGGGLLSAVVSAVAVLASLSFPGSGVQATTVSPATKSMQDSGTHGRIINSPCRLVSPSKTGEPDGSLGCPRAGCSGRR